MSATATAPADAAGGRGAERFVAGDGLRCYAAVGVLVFHAFLLAFSVSPEPVGRTDVAARLAFLSRLGLWLFFGLSGYLITRPFIAAYVSGTARPDVAGYLRNRALRIVPALWLTIVLTIVVFGTLGAGKRQVLAMFLFVQELDRSALSDHMTHAWSVNVEAGFYIAVPLLMALAFRWRRSHPATEAQRAAAVWAGLAVLLAGSLGLQLVLGRELLTPGLPRSLPINLYAFLPGVALAVTEVRLSRPGHPVAIPRWTAPALLAAAVGASVLHMLLVPTAAAWIAAAAAMVASGAVVALALVRQWSGRGSSRFVDNPVTRWVGERSYGVYLLHLGVLIYLGEHLEHRSVWAMTLLLIAISLPVTIALAALSYRFVERPFLRLRHGWRQAAASRNRST